MTKEQFTKVLEDMSPLEREKTFIFYLKDIKDLLESICDANKIEKKHYD